MKPQIIMPEVGIHNADLESARTRLIQGDSYRDCSTVCIIPTRGGRSLHPRVVQSWFNLMPPMNQKFARLFATGMEVGDAYSQTLEQILANPELSKWKYLLTMEDDNLPPPDGLLRLLESIQNYDAVGGLYWTKGPGGQPMIYGDPREMPRNFRPQLVVPDQVQPCNGLGMGFTLFRMKMFKNKNIKWPLFKTRQEWLPGQGTANMTQDLAAFQQLAGLGYKFASDNRVKVGHMEVDSEEGLVW